MPHSRPDARPWVTRQAKRLKPQTILDVGAGAGTYWKLLHKTLRATWTAVEIHRPYVDEYALWQKYDTVMVGDFMDLVILKHDLVILGDVLEHVDYEQGRAMWRKARTLGTVLLVLPLDDFEQGEVNGNPYEAHLHHWKHSEVMALGGVTAHWKNGRKGAYLAE